MNNQLAQIINPVIDDLGSGDGGSSLAIIMANLFGTMIMVGGLALLLYLTWGGIQWLMAGDDKTKVEAARNRITNAIIGMAILFAASGIAALIGNKIGIDVLNLEVPTV